MSNKSDISKQEASSMLSPSELVIFSDTELFEELGKAVRSEQLGALPEEEDAEFEDSIVGINFFQRQLINIHKLFCKNPITEHLSNDKKQSVDLFVAAFIDSFIGYYGAWAGTVILVQIYKIGIKKFCSGSNQ